MPDAAPARHPAARPIALALALVVLAGACGTGQTVNGGPTTPSGPSGPEGFPTGADEVVVQVHDCCGFVPFSVALSAVPPLTIFGDGTTVVAANRSVSDRFPALVRQRRGHLSRPEIAGLLDLARRSGLLGDEVDFGSPQVTDLPSTAVVLVVDGREVVQSAYALREEFEDDLPADARAARQRLRAFLDEAELAVGQPSQEYRPERISVFAQPSESSDGTDPKGAARPWPFADPAAWPEGERSGSYRCRTFAGSDAAAVVAAAAPAEHGDRWLAGAERWDLVFRPLLPDEVDACAG